MVSDEENRPYARRDEVRQGEVRWNEDGNYLLDILLKLGEGR